MGVNFDHADEYGADNLDDEEHLRLGHKPYGCRSCAYSTGLCRRHLVEYGMDDDPEPPPLGVFDGR